MRLILFLILLSACASPSMEFAGTPAVTIRLEGDEIKVYHKGTRAQAIRINSRTKSQRSGAVDRLALAITLVTGCAVRDRGMKSDVVLLTASLKCP